jgi:hypothetical protein
VCPGRAGNGLLYFEELAFCQKPDALVRADVERLSQHLSKIVTHAFYLADGNYQFLAALNVLAGNSEDVLVLGLGQMNQ